MKTIFLQKSNRGRSRSLLRILSAVLLLFFVAILIGFAPDSSNRFAVATARPLWLVRTFFGDKLDFLTNFTRPKSNLIKENEELKRELDQARAETIFYGALSTEYGKLLSVLDRSLEDEKNFGKLGTVLAKPPQSPYDTLVIDIGRAAGVSAGDLVLSFGNIALGRVNSVEESHATVLLFSNGGAETQAIVERSDLSLVLTGKGGGGFEVKLPQDADIAVDDLIVLPGLLPTPLGQVVKIDTAAASSFKTVSVRALANVNNIRWVEVKKN